MQCAKFEQQLQSLLDDRKDVDQDKTLLAHSKVCESCSSMLRAQTRIFAELKLLPPLSDEQHLAHRVLDQLRIDQRRRKNRRLVLIAFATAATILIALLPFAGDRVRMRQDGELRGGRLAIVTPAPQNSLSEQETEDLRLVMRQLLMRISDRRLEMLEPVDQLTNSIRPLALTFNFALDTLRRTLPGYSEPQSIDPQASHWTLRFLVS